MRVIGRGNPAGLICNDGPELKDFCSRCFHIFDPLNCGRLLESFNNAAFLNVL